jgi:hypothetical protein
MATLVAPFAGDTSHLGHRRASRFARWLSDAGYDISIICSGECTIHSASVLSIRDPLGVWPASGKSTSVATRGPVKGGRGIARRLLVPDPSIGWALRVCCSRGARALAARSSVLISTGPPESPHVCASFLARMAGIPHLMDYRDGWLDEPLKQEIRTSGLRRTIEGLLEAWVVSRATAITVTSDEWGTELTGRYASVHTRVHTLTNVIPANFLSTESQGEAGAPPRLLYAGRLSGSRSTQSAGALLSILEREAAATTKPWEVVFMGDLSESELTEIGRFRDAVAEFDWTVLHQSACDYQSALGAIAQADGLLLLSASHAAIPSKLFDYLATGRPILCLTHPDSAVWRLCRDLTQVWLTDISAGSSTVGFCSQLNMNRRQQPPLELTEARVAERFVNLVEGIRNDSQLARSTPGLGRRQARPTS